MEIDMNKEKQQDDIAELVGTLRSYKTMILAITLISLILSLLYTAIWHKDIYRTGVSIQLAQRGQVTIEPIDMYLQRLSTLFPKISNIQITDEKKGIIRLVILDNNKDNLINFLDKTVQEIFNLDNTIEHNVSKKLRGYQNYIDYFKDRIDKSLKNKSKTSAALRDIREQAMKDLDLKTNSNEKISNENLLPAMKTINTYLRFELLKSHADRYDAIIKWAKNKISPKFTFETHIFENKKEDIIQITPSKSIVVTAAAVSGLLFAVLLSLILSFLSNRKKI